MTPLVRDVPRIVGPLPGPRAAAWLARDEEVMSPSYTRIYPLVVRRAKGAMIEDLDGNRFLDFTAGDRRDGRRPLPPARSSPRSASRRGG